MKSVPADRVALARELREHDAHQLQSAGGRGARRRPRHRRHAGRVQRGLDVELDAALPDAAPPRLRDVQQRDRRQQNRRGPAHRGLAALLAAVARDHRLSRELRLSAHPPAGQRRAVPRGDDGRAALRETERHASNTYISHQCSSFTPLRGVHQSTIVLHPNRHTQGTTKRSADDARIHSKPLWLLVAGLAASLLGTGCCKQGNPKNPDGGGSDCSGLLCAVTGIPQASGLSFGNVPVGQSVSLKLVLHNAGTAPLNLTGKPTATITGTNAADSSARGSPCRPRSRSTVRPPPPSSSRRRSPATRPPRSTSRPMAHP